MALFSITVLCISDSLISLEDKAIFLHILQSNKILHKCLLNNNKISKH